MLQITSTYPSFDLEIYWPRADIRQEVAKVQVETIGPEIKIDQLQSRNELGIGGFEFYSRQVRDGAYQKTIEAIGKMAAAGDEVVHRAGHFREEMILAEQAKRATMEQIPELNIRAAPTTRPKISFDYRQDINWSQGGVSITHQVRPPEITWTLGGVKVDVRG
ncbi:MAG TPA: DUF6470 family protein [Limnochordia bacterium]|nr:DUF6470 family protein [Limnochordia bacterium]